MSTNVPNVPNTPAPRWLVLPLSSSEGELDSMMFVVPITRELVTGLLVRAETLPADIKAVSIDADFYVAEGDVGDGLKSCDIMNATSVEDGIVVCVEPKCTPVRTDDECCTISTFGVEWSCRPRHGDADWTTWLALADLVQLARSLWSDEASAAGSECPVAAPVTAGTTAQSARSTTCVGDVGPHEVAVTFSSGVRRDYRFETEREADAFKLGLAEMDGCTGYRFDGPRDTASPAIAAALPRERARALMKAAIHGSYLGVADLVGAGVADRALELIDELMDVVVLSDERDALNDEHAE